MKQWKLIVAILVALMLALAYVTPFDIGVATGASAKKLSDGTDSILVENLHPYYAMFGQSWYVATVDSGNKEITITCYSSIARMGVRGRSHSIVVSAKGLANNHVGDVVKIYANSGSSRYLISEVEL